MYKAGVITGDSCGKTVDLGVTIVGYGSEEIHNKTVDYFIVKNAWSSGWGEQGYVRLGTNNVCGVLMELSYPESN
jgi:C1A family cysteine protease